ncbi:hypothetical protein BJQ97_03275 [Geobacillus sp. TFV-3]|nr:branched-chain amino acid transport system II carrier protein [Geobacillus sp. TFV-3]KAF0996585.1 hypothetical protein BJQ97_03275 [Geobacillus sp. TFV-3]
MRFCFAAAAFAKDGLRSLGDAVHPLFSFCFSLAVYLAIGPFFGIPRAASVAYEIGAKPFFADGGAALGKALDRTLANKRKHAA